MGLTTVLLKAQKDLAELNLLGHIFTRTRKREVQTNFPTRKAFPLRLNFTDLEMAFLPQSKKTFRGRLRPPRTGPDCRGNANFLLSEAARHVRPG